MPGASNIIYCYDGSFPGLLCCVYESVYTREIPLDILPETEAGSTLFPEKRIVSDQERAKRVFASIAKKISPQAEDLVESVFFSCAPKKEMLILRFLLLGYQKGRQTVYLASHPDVQPLYAARVSLYNEAHLLKGFIRFSDCQGALVATITPKNYVLPYLRAHFCTRFANENLLIYDKTHGAALIYQDGNVDIVALEGLEVPAPDAQEIHYRALWKQFYKTIAIAARENPRCRMTHMPKRYWENMLELQPD